MIQRQGVQGRVKHISLKVLWLQDLRQSGILSITAVQTRYKAMTASRVRFLLSLFRFFTGNPDSHEAVGLQEQAEQLDIEALQVLRALRKDSDFHRHDRSVLGSLVDSVHGSNSSTAVAGTSATVLAGTTTLVTTIAVVCLHCWFQVFLLEVQRPRLLQWSKTPSQEASRGCSSSCRT